MSIMKILKRSSVQLSHCSKRFLLSIPMSLDQLEVFIILVEFISHLDSILFLSLKSGVLSKKIMMTWLLFLILSQKPLHKLMENII